MLDYQINNAITEAYLKIHEGANDVPTSISRSIDDTPELKKRFNEKLAREAEERAKRDAEIARLRNQTYISAKPQWQIDRDQQIEEQKKYLQSAEGRKALLQRQMAMNDPTMRIGNGVYDGISLMLPGAALGRMSKVAKAGSAVANTTKAASVGQKIIPRALTAYGSHSFGNEMGDLLDKHGFKKTGAIVKGIGDAGAAAALIGKNPVPAPKNPLQTIAFGVPGGFGVSQIGSDVANALEKRGVSSNITEPIEKTADYIGFGLIGKPAYDALGDYVIAPAVSYAAKKFGNRDEQPNNSNEQSFGGADLTSSDNFTVEYD